MSWIFIAIVCYAIMMWVTYQLGVSRGKYIQRENDLTIYLSTGKMEDHEGRMVTYKKPRSKKNGQNRQVSNSKGNSKKELVGEE